MQKTLEKYNLRNERKKEIEFSARKKPDVKIGELRWCREGMNVGNEISKDKGNKRIYVILQNNLGNELVLAAPITTRIRKELHSVYTLPVLGGKKYNLKPCEIIINQIKLIDRKRLDQKNSNKRFSLGFITKILHMYWSLISKS